MFKEIIPCADGGPTPPPHMLDVASAYYVGVYDDKGTIISDFFDNEAEARAAYDRIYVPYSTTPELLSALNGAYEFCQQGLNSPHPEHWEASLYDILELVQEAIAKAEGA